MTHPFDRLAKLDRQRGLLALYEARLNRLFFAKALRDRQLRRVQKAWMRVNNERQHLFSLIMADPALREAFKERERSEIAHKLKIGAKSIFPDDPEVDYHALETVRAMVAERQARNAYQDAVWYRKRGEWRNQNVSAADIDQLVQTLRQELGTAVQRRAEAQHDFEIAGRRQFGDVPGQILKRELVLEEAAEHFKKTESLNRNAFVQWLHARGLAAPQPKKTRQLKM